MEFFVVQDCELLCSDKLESLYKRGSDSRDFTVYLWTMSDPYFGRLGRHTGDKFRNGITFTVHCVSATIYFIRKDRQEYRISFRTR